jgi:23S rRNA pseudouridine2605 synthase
MQKHSDVDKPKKPTRERRHRPSPATSTAPKDDKERLHKRIAASGLCSRRAAEKIILEGRVLVNGKVVTEMGIKVGPEDEVRVDGNPIDVAKPYTLIMNKPVGYLTTLSDPQRRQTVAQLLPNLDFQVKPVGRLDMDSEGLLLFTNDGALAQRLTHPRFGVDKEYHVLVTGTPTEEELARLRKGIWIEEGGKTAPAKVEYLRTEKKSANSMMKIVIHEGRKRQVRLMFEAIGHPVLSLRRVRFGPLVLKNLPPGACRMLGKKEVDKLKEMVKLI